MKKSIPILAGTLLARVTIVSALALPLIVCRHGNDAFVSVGESPAPNGETARSAYDFVNSIGVNTHLNYFDRTYGNFALVERELTSVGILHVRDGVHLQNADYNHSVYGRWVQLGRNGIRFDAVVDPRSQLGPITPALLDQVNALAGNTIESLEGPNELDISNMPQWASQDRGFQKALFDAVRSMKSADAIQAIGPSMAFARHGSDVGELSDCADAVNLHPYPAGKPPAVIFPEQIALARKMAANEPIIVTETGYHNALNDHHDQPAVSEAAAAKYIPRLLLENYAHGLRRSYLYELLDEAPDPELKDNQLHWGLIRADGTEKPAFIASKNLIAELRDTQRVRHPQQLVWTISSHDGNIHHVLLEKSNGEFDLILWQEVSSYSTLTGSDIRNQPVSLALTLGRQVRSVALYEPSVQPQALRTYNNVSSIPLQIPDSPLVIAIAP